MDLSDRCILMSAFLNCQFNYCPLVWKCHNGTTNRKLNRLHKICLHIIYNNKQPSLEKLLEKDSSVSIHNRNIQYLAVEMYKFRIGLSPPLIRDNLNTKIVILTTWDTILSFLDHLLSHLKEKKRFKFVTFRVFLINLCIDRTFQVSSIFLVSGNLEGC